MRKNVPTIKLNDGNEMPVFGFGTFQIPADGSTYKAVREALDAGIRFIDTAAAYFNEKEVGQAIKDSGIPREEIFVTSKLWIQDYGYEPAKKGLEASLKRLDMDYIDLYLLHQPFFDVVGAWKALEEAKAEGKVKSIGVDNMTINKWNEFVPQFDTVPAVNLVEYNPYVQQKELHGLMKENGVILQSWGPLGQGNRELLTDPVVVTLSEKYGKDAGQIILRFEIQEGVVVFPKSTKSERMKSNMDIFDFSLTEEEMNQMRALDKGAGSFNPDRPGIDQMMLNAFDVHTMD